MVGTVSSDDGSMAGISSADVKKVDAMVWSTMGWRSEVRSLLETGRFVDSPPLPPRPVPSRPAPSRPVLPVPSRSVPTLFLLATPQRRLGGKGPVLPR